MIALAAAVLLLVQATVFPAKTTFILLAVPTTIARLNVPYGDNGGWPAFHLAMILADRPVPVRPGGPSRFNPIHEDDIIAMVPRLLDVATVPATVVNWGGDEESSIEEWSTYLADLVRREVHFDLTTETLGGIPTDNTRRLELVGPTKVGWRQGMRRMVEAMYPELVG